MAQLPISIKFRYKSLQMMLPGLDVPLFAIVLSGCNRASLWPNSHVSDSSRPQLVRHQANIQGALAWGCTWYKSTRLIVGA